MKRTIRWNFALASLLLAACITVNVYFPAAAAEKAADQFIDHVNGVATGSAAPKQDAPAPATPASGTPPKTSFNPNQTQPALLLAAGRVLEALVPTVYAADSANIDLSSAEIRVIEASMAERMTQLKPYFDSGAVGYTTTGLLDVRDAALVPLAQRAVVKRLVAEDNKDRETLYAEIARANGHPEWTDDIRGVFARRWVARAAAGWYYQNGSGAWVQK